MNIQLSFGGTAVVGMLGERSRDGYRDINADKSFSVYNRRWGTLTWYKLDFIEACSREGDSLES